MQVVNSKFRVETKKRAYMMPVTMGIDNGRIEFLKSPFALKDEIKAMQGARWHGNDTENPRKIWSVADSYRNRFQIEWLSGGNPYEWFDKPIIEHDYPKFGSEGFGYFDLMSQQRLMANTGLTYHYQIWAAEMGVGKTLSAIAMMQLSLQSGFWWVGPKSSLPGIRQEFDNWGLDPDICPLMMSYEGLLKTLREWKSGDPAPIGVIFDEAHLLKTPDAQRTKAAQALADAIREEHDKDGFVILMTGTPSPKSPGDWWALCEIAWPGFLKEGTRQAFEKRMGFFRIEGNNDLAGGYPVRVSWKDDEERCGVCGQYLYEGHHMTNDGEIIERDIGQKVHVWEPSINEVANLPDRLTGLVTIVHKKDCLDLPDKIYKEVICEPQPSLLRVAGALKKTCANSAVAAQKLRQISDGFQYREVEDGYKDCDACTDGTEKKWTTKDGKAIYDIQGLSKKFVDQLKEEVGPCSRCKGTRKITKYKTVTREVACPKIDAINDLLDQNTEQGRLVIFAGYTGSIDRLVKVALKAGWDTMRLDGRGYQIKKWLGETTDDGSPNTETIKIRNLPDANPLNYWTDSNNEKVVFIAHPKSGGVSLTLSPKGNLPGATMAVYYSNDFHPASRSQSEDRIHRKGMDLYKGATIVDLIHLPSDRRVLQVLRDNRKVELMSMGELFDVFDKE